MAMSCGGSLSPSFLSMRVRVRYTEEVTTPVQEMFLTVVAKETLERCPLAGLARKEEVSLNVIAVSPERIQELNRTYRGKDAVTDILSFGEYADTEALEQDLVPDVFLGEIFFCQQVIADAAQQDAVSIEHELTYVFSHGVLHLLGYDHSDEMFALQDAVTGTLMKQKFTV